MECRLGCGACCIAPSISSRFPLHPDGKPAGERCKQLDSNNLCLLFGKPERPDVCHDFKADKWVCGKNASEALVIITDLESHTQ